VIRTWLPTAKNRTLTTSPSRTCKLCPLSSSDLSTEISPPLRSNKVLEVVKSVVQGQETVPSVINREMKKERVEEVREAKAEVTSGME
jgi:hypothetical protein